MRCGQADADALCRCLVRMHFKRQHVVSTIAHSQVRAPTQQHDASIHVDDHRVEHGRQQRSTVPSQLHHACRSRCSRQPELVASGRRGPDDDGGFIAAQRLRSDQAGRRGIEEPAIEVLRQQRTALLEPCLVVGPREAESRLPVGRDEAESRGRRRVVPAADQVLRVFEIRQCLLRIGCNCVEPTPTGFRGSQRCPAGSACRSSHPPKARS